MRVAGDPQAPMTGIAGGVDDLPDQVAGDTTAAPVRIDEEVLEFGTVVLARGDGSEPDDPVVARWAGRRDVGTAGGMASPVKTRNSGRASNIGASPALDNDAARYTRCNAGRSAATAVRIASPDSTRSFTRRLQ